MQAYEKGIHKIVVLEWWNHIVVIPFNSHRQMHSLKVFIFFNDNRTLLKYNLYVVQCTDLKCTVSWILTNIYTDITITEIKIWNNPINPESFLVTPVPGPTFLRAPHITTLPPIKRWDKDLTGASVTHNPDLSAGTAHQSSKHLLS